MINEWEITNGIIVNDSSVIENKNLNIKNGKISGYSDISRDVPRINLGGMYIYPGLVNAHDHLLGSYLPKVGNNSPYLTWLAWDNDLKSSAVFAERQQLETEQLYLLGAYRHLLCGVTTVMDHMPHFVNKQIARRLPVRLVSRYSLAHSVCSYSLGWGEEIADEYRQAEHEKIPFVTHIGEGFDEESNLSLKTLEEEGGLGEFSVLVHCLPYGESQIQQIKKKGASVVWCPSSNEYLFQKTTDVKKFLDAGINVSLGTDNPMSGSLNIFEEIRIARDSYMKKYQEELPASTVFRMLTTNPAKALRLEGAGEIKPGNLADLLVLNKRFEDPYVNLCEAEMEDVRLVSVAGVPMYGDVALKPFFDLFEGEYETIKIGKSEKLVTGSPKNLLKKIHDTLGYKKSLAFLPLE